MSRGLFNLENLNSMDDNDILKVNINEAGEFGSQDPATNPTVDFDPNATSAKDNSVSIPGGLKETPNAKPADGEVSIAVPGGNGEAPSSKPYDNSSVSIPSKTTLTADQYNQAISNLKKSFKEAVEVLDLMEGATVVQKTTEELQREYTESVLEKAMLEAYEDGPIFEKVTRDDKDDVKDIVRKIRKTVKKQLKGEKVHFYEPHVVLRILTGPIPGIGTMNAAAGIQQVWTNRLWQVLGVMHVDEGNVKEIIAKLNETFKEDLGEYKIIESLSFPAIYDLLRVKFNWKNRNSAYFLIVDKKLPSDIKAAQKEISGIIDDAGSEKDKKDEAEPKKDDKAE